MKKLTKKTNQKVVAVAMVLLLLISVGYAAISTQLQITGTANIAATSWDVHYGTITPSNGSVSATTGPSISGNTISFAVTLEKPGDFYEFTVPVINAGTINAKIAENGVTKSSLSAQEDVIANYTVTYADGSAIAAGDKLAKAGTTVNSVAQDVKTVKVRVEYDPSITAEQLNAMGNSDVTLNLSFSLKYVQD